MTWLLPKWWLMSLASLLISRIVLLGGVLSKSCLFKWSCFARPLQSLQNSEFLFLFYYVCVSRNQQNHVWASSRQIQKPQWSQWLTVNVTSACVSYCTVADEMRDKPKKNKLSIRRKRHGALMKTPEWSYQEGRLSDWITNIMCKTWKATLLLDLLGCQLSFLLQISPEYNEK